MIKCNLPPKMYPKPPQQKNKERQINKQKKQRTIKNKLVTKNPRKKTERGPKNKKQQRNLNIEEFYRIENNHYRD
jgi:hypothetical protein